MRLLPRHLAYRSEIVDPEELNAAEQKLQLIIQSQSFPLERQQLAQENKFPRKALLPFTRPSLELVAYYGPPAASSVSPKMN